MTDAAGTSRILTLVFTDLADSTGLKTRHGDHAVGELITRHRAHVHRLAAESGGRIIDWAGDGCFLTFETPSAAVSFALRLQQAHRDEPELPEVRTGIHMGEVSDRPRPDGDAAHPRVEGLAVDLAARISSLARPVQDEITEQVVATIAGMGVISQARCQEMEGKATDDLAAYECVLLAQASIRDAFVVGQGRERVRSCLQRAVRDDPGYADAWAELTWVPCTSMPTATLPAPTRWRKPCERRSEPSSAIRTIRTRSTRWRTCTSFDTSSIASSSRRIAPSRRTPTTR